MVGRNFGHPVVAVKNKLCWRIKKNTKLRLPEMMLVLHY